MKHISLELIIASSLKVDDDHNDSDDISIAARQEIEKEARNSTLDRTYEPMRWGNSRGLSALENMEETRARFENLERITSDQSAEIKTLKIEVEGLKLTSAAYLDIRNRFFAVFLRDKCRKFSSADQKAIKEGNCSAHEGDPLVDATMFQKGVRRDDKTFILLYGMSWNRVLEYAVDKDTIRLLAAYATAVANTSEPAVEQIGENVTQLHIHRNSPIAALRKALQTFIDALDESGYPQGYRNDLTAPATLAYWRFWDTHKLFQQSVKTYQRVERKDEGMRSMDS